MLSKHVASRGTDYLTCAREVSVVENLPLTLAQKLVSCLSFVYFIVAVSQNTRAILPFSKPGVWYYLNVLVQFFMVTHVLSGEEARGKMDLRFCLVLTYFCMHTEKQCYFDSYLLFSEA